MKRRVTMEIVSNLKHASLIKSFFALYTKTMAEEEDTEADLLGKAFEFLETRPEKEIKQYFKRAGDGESPRFQLTAYERAEHEEEEPPPVLDPEHPLLAKFQKALKEHLEKQIEHLTDEIFELETGAKKQEAEHEKLGAEAYEVQQTASKQQTDLENSIVQLQNIYAAREETECTLQQSVEQHKKDRARLFESEKKEIELRNEVESVNLLVQQLTKWEDNIESELLVNQRMFEKTKKDKVKLAVDKRQQDMIIYKLMTEVWKLESELETMCMQLRVKEEEREKLAETMAVSNTDIEASEAEHRCLLHGWNSVIVAISNRDKHYNLVNAELTNLTEKLHSILSEIEQVKKLSTKEMNQNETLTMFKGRVDADLKNCAYQLQGEITKKDNLERVMMKTQAIIDQIDKDINKVTAENHRKTHDLSCTVKQLEKLSMRKFSLEEDILNGLQEQITNDKATKYLSKMLYDVKHKNRDMEINLAYTENKNAKVLMDIEGQKGVNEQLLRALEELKKQQAVVDKKLDVYEDEIQKCLSCMSRKQREIDILNKKIEKIVLREGDTSKSPHELKISSLEQLIEQMQEKNNELQTFWLREQGHIVGLSQQRQEQIHDSNLLRKQIMILEQRNLKINDELEVHKKQEEQMTRSINKLQNRLVFFTETLNRKKGNKNNLDENNSLLQNQFISNLKDAEMMIIKLESQMTDMEVEMESLTKDLMEKSRESLEWEKKWKMVAETKQNIIDEKGEGGEVGNMKIEIHRMNVRYGQLRKAQEKLIQDLEHCVARRDTIVTNAEAREKRVVGTQTQVFFARKLDDTRNKLKQMQNDIEGLENEIAYTLNEEKRLRSQVNSTEDDIITANNRYTDIQRRIEQAKTDKQLSLEILVCKQRKQKMYSELAKGRQPFLVYKSDSAITNEYCKQRDLNDKLQSVVDNLMTRYPKMYQNFLRILNTLRMTTLSL